jgi:hypothetical protein
MRALMYRDRLMRWFGVSLWRSLGSCLCCMRSSFRAAAIAWVLTGVSQTFPVPTQWLTGTSIAAAALTVLWLGHLLAHSVKVSAAGRLSRGAGSKQGPVSRRELMPIFARAFAMAAIATSIPNLASAECDKAAAERCQTAASGCRSHCSRAFHREEEIRACHQECYANYTGCRNEARCS